MKKMLCNFVRVQLPKCELLVEKLLPLNEVEGPRKPGPGQIETLVPDELRPGRG